LPMQDDSRLLKVNIGNIRSSLNLSADGKELRLPIQM